MYSIKDLRSSSDSMFFILLFFAAQTNYAEITPIPKTAEINIAVDTMVDPDWKTRDLYVFRPDSFTGPCPVILFRPTFSSRDPSEYHEFIEHAVKAGNVLIFHCSRKLSFTRNKIVKYDLGVSAIENVIKKYPRLDTTRIGVVGHGFGAGATPALMRKLLLKNWGRGGAFLYLLSPWYLYSINEREITDFPGKVTLVVQAFEDDNYNDPAIGADIFNLFRSDISDKYYIFTRSIRSGNRKIKADFNLPLGAQSAFGSLDLLDTSAFFNIADNLERCCFRGDSLFSGISINNNNNNNNKPFKRNIVIGKNNDGKDICPMIISNKPIIPTEKHLYVNDWNSWRNPRINTASFRQKRAVDLRHKSKKLHEVNRYVLKSAFSLIHEVNGREEEKKLMVENPITKGYGANGRYKAFRVKIKNPLKPEMLVYTFFPDTTDARFPVIFFLHGYNGGDPEYFEPFIDHLVSRGYVVIFPQYPLLPGFNKKENVVEKYNIAYSGLEYAAERFRNKIDTSRIAFFGHSFGGGMIPDLAYRLILNKKWGTSGACMFISAPWYIYNITSDQLRMFPSNVKLLTITYSDDTFNDHRIAIDLFKTINIPASEKNYCTFFSDTVDGLTFEANHFVPYGPANINGSLDNFDYYGIFKLFDALLDYSLTGNLKAKETALGNGSASQCFMGTVGPNKSKPIRVTDNPKADISQMHYIFAWNNKLNPRLPLQPSLFKRGCKGHI